MGINVAGVSGIETTRRVTENHPDVMVILLPTYDAADLLPDVHTCGAVASLHKERAQRPGTRQLWDQAETFTTRQAISWPITITNDGPGAMLLASGRPFFQIQLPSGLANVFLTSPGGHSCYLAATNLVECATTSTLTLAAGSSLSYTLGALAPDTPGTMTVTVTVDPSSHVSEADEGDNTASEITTVVAGS